MCVCVRAGGRARACVCSLFLLVLYLNVNVRVCACVGGEKENVCACGRPAERVDGQACVHNMSIILTNRQYVQCTRFW